MNINMLELYGMILDVIKQDGDGNKMERDI